MVRPFVRRFRRNARILVLIAAAVLIGVVVAAVYFLMTGDVSAGLVLGGVGLSMLVTATLLAVVARPRMLALRRAGAANADGAVFLARRQPAAVSDLATYLNDPEIYDMVSDRWVVSSISANGMAAWSIGADSRELIVIPWEIIGDITPIRLENGGDGVAVDVKPYADPLVVAVGYASFGVMSTFSGRGIAEVIATANALRPRD